MRGSAASRAAYGAYRGGVRTDKKIKAVTEKYEFQKKMIIFKNENKR